MNGLTDQRFLDSARLRRIFELAGPRLERTRPLTFLNRLGMVNAADEDLVGKFTSREIAADIIADNQEANVYEGGKVDLVTTSLPNVKIGRGLDQGTINRLARLEEFPRTQDEDAQMDWETRFAETLLMGVRDRLNYMACAMMLDNFDYSRWGIKLVGASWGMPSLLKVTPSALWSPDGGATANASAKPISDILKFDRIDADNYGLGKFDRVTMSSQAFDIMVQTDDFYKRAALFTGQAFAPTAGVLELEARTDMVNLAGRILRKEIVLDDKMIREKAAEGTMTTTRVSPANKVLLDRAGNGSDDWDMGNGIVTESLVAKILGAPMLGDTSDVVAGGMYGPVGYYTGRPTLNPPDLTGWAVSRSFPRKHNDFCSAVLTIW
jgi:hypothetical protein